MPDAARFFRLLRSYRVEQLIITQRYTKLLMKNEEFQHLWQSSGFLCLNPTVRHFSAAQQQEAAEHAADNVFTCIRVIYSVTKGGTPAEEAAEIAGFLTRLAPEAQLISVNC